MSSEAKPDQSVATVEVDNALSQDDRDMIRMGKVQETRRLFGLFPLLGLTTIMLASWETTLPIFAYGLIDGGGPSVLYGFIFAFFGSLALCASISEMASIWPTSGGQYHWIALLAPPKLSKFLSWLVGWLTVLGWQSGCAAGSFFGGTMIQGLLVLNYPDYGFERWHGTLIMYAIILISLFTNTVIVRALPVVEGTVLILHIVGFFAILIPFVHRAPMRSAHEVWVEFQNMSGGYPDGVSWLVALVVSVQPLVGFDGACHMAEEVKNAAINVPRSMFYTIFINGALGFAMYIALLFGVGPIGKALSSATGYPFMEIFYNAVQSKGGATAMISVVIFLLVCGSIGFLASASRQLWAFSRDRGMPFSNWLSTVNPTYKIPIPSVAATVTFSVLVGLINIGSATALNAIISTLIASLFTSYIVSICLMIRKRLSGEPLRLGPWNLGRWGTPINVFAIIYSIIAIVFSFFPITVNPTLDYMNWSCVMFPGIVIIGLVYYVFRARHIYNGPIIHPRFRNAASPDSENVVEKVE
jgi:amino acid transporter